MLYQLHYDTVSGESDFVAQIDMGDDWSHEKLDAWLRDVASRHPLPEGRRPVIHTEKSPKFLWMGADPAAIEEAHDGEDHHV